MSAARRYAWFALAFCGSMASYAAIGAESKSGADDIQLGEIPKYADEGAALAACAPDGVVWADRKTGFYYPKFFKDYGATAHGAYTCHKSAKAADYWSLTPASDGGHVGRTFPEFFCYACS